MSIYVIRNLETGLYYRSGKVRYGRVQRAAWVAEPEKAWHSWQGFKEAARLLEGHFRRDELPPYEIVEMKLVPYTSQVVKPKGTP